MANYDLGTARGTIELDYKGDGPKRAKDDLDELQSKSGRTAEAYDRVGGTFQKAGAVMGAGIAVAVKSAADFEQKMSNIKAVSGASGAEMEQLGNKAMQLGKDTSFSASEAADAITELIKAGVGVPDVMNGAADATVALAEAGEIDLKQAAGVMTDAMSIFGKSAAELPKVADVMAGAAKSSKLEVSDLAESLKYVGPVAAAAGVSFEDTATALTILGQNGLKGSEAGTALRGMLVDLTPTTEKARDRFKELGLITKDGANIFYDAQGKMKPLGEVINILREHTKGLSDQEKITFYKEAFGVQTMPALINLTKGTADQFDNLKKSLEGTSAADIAAEKMNNFKGSLEQLKGSLETFMIVAGTPLLKVLRDLVDGLTGFVNKLLELPPGVVAVGTKVAIFASGLLIAVGTIMKIIGAIARFKLALETLGIIDKISKVLLPFLGRALGAIGTVATGPIGIAIAAIAALIAIFYELYKHNPKFKAFVDGLIKAFKDYVMLGVDRAREGLRLLKEGFDGVTTATGFKGFLQDIGAAARTLWDALKNLWEVWKTTIWPILKDGASQVWQALKQAWQDMSPALSELWASLKELWKAMEPLRKPLLEILGTVLKLVAGFLLWSAKMNLDTIVALINLTAAIMEKLAPAIKFAIDVIVNMIKIWTDLITWIVKVITKIVEFAAAVATQFTNAKNSVVTLVDQIVAKIGEIWSGIKAVIDRLEIMWNAFWVGHLPGPVGDAMRLVSMHVQKGMDEVKGWFDTQQAIIDAAWVIFWGKIRDFVAPVWEPIKTAVSDGLTAVHDLITTATEPITTAWTNFWNAVRDYVAPIWAAIKGIVTGGMTDTKTAIDTGTPPAKSSWDTFWNSIRDFLGPIWATIKQTVSDGITAISGLITSIGTTVQTSWNTFWTSIRDFVAPIWTSIKQTVTDGMNGISSTISTIGATIKSGWDAFWSVWGPPVQQAWGLVKDIVNLGMAVVKDQVVTQFVSIKQSWNQNWTDVKNFVGPIWESIKTTISSAWTSIKTTISSAITSVRDQLSSQWNSIKSTAESIWNSLKSAASSIWNSIKDTIVNAANSAKTTLASAWASLKSSAESNWNSIKSSASSIWGGIKSAIEGPVNAVKGALQTVWNAIKDFTTQAWNSIKDAIVKPMNDAKSAVSGPVGEIKKVITDAWNVVKTATSDAWGKFSSTIKTQVDKAIGFVDGIKAKVDQAFKDVGTWLLESGKNLVQGFIDGISKKLSDLRTKVQEMTDLTKQHTQQQLEQHSPSQVFFRYGAFTIQGFIDGFGSLMDKVRTMVQEFTDLVKKAVQEKAGLDTHSPSKIFFQYGEFTIQGYIDGFGSLVGRAKTMIDQFVEMIKKVPGVKLELGSPSKVFFGFGADTIQGFINGLESKFPELRQTFDQVQSVVDQLGNRMPAALAKGRDAINAISDLMVKGDFASFGRVFNVQEDDPLVDKLLTLRDMMIDKIPGAAEKARAAISKLLASGKFGDLVSEIQPIIDKVSPELQKISDRIRPPLNEILDKVRNFDLATPMQKVADKMQPIIDHLKTMVGDIRNIDIEGTLRNLSAKLAPLAPTIESALRSGNLQSIANLVPQVAPGLPKITVTPGQITNTFPDKITLRVGDREFDAYVDGRADSLLSQAAALLSRGVK